MLAHTPAHGLINCSAFTGSTLHLSTTDIRVSKRKGLISLLFGAWSDLTTLRHIQRNGSHQRLATSSGLSLQHPALSRLLSGLCSSGFSDNSDTSVSGELVLSCTSKPANRWHQFMIMVEQGDSCSFICVRERSNSNIGRIICSQKSSSSGSQFYLFPKWPGP